MTALGFTAFDADMRYYQVRVYCMRSHRGAQGRSGWTFP